MKTDIKERIVNMVVEKMNDTGLAPWDAGFLVSNLPPVNAISGKRYRGINAILLGAFGCGANEFVTFKQAQKLGGMVKQGEKGIPVVWYTRWNITKSAPAGDADDEDDEIIPYMRYSTVFELSQCGLSGKRKPVERTERVQTDADIENWFDTFSKATDLKKFHSIDTACYAPASHSVYIRNIDEYKTNSHYYQTLFHECTHSTKKALGRKQARKFSDKIYSQEEIVAEMGSLFLCQYFGIEKEQLDNSSAYLKSWGNQLKEHPDWLLKGVNQAERAYDYMLEKGGIIIE